MVSKQTQTRPQSTSPKGPHLSRPPLAKANTDPGMLTQRPSRPSLAHQAQSWTNGMLGSKASRKTLDIPLLFDLVPTAKGNNPITKLDSVDLWERPEGSSTLSKKKVTTTLETLPGLWYALLTCQDVVRKFNLDQEKHCIELSFEWVTVKRSSGPDLKGQYSYSIVRVTQCLRELKNPHDLQSLQVPDVHVGPLGNLGPADKRNMLREIGRQCWSEDINHKALANKAYADGVW